MAMDQFEERRQIADLSFLLQGITFTVYSDGRGRKGCSHSTWYRASWPIGMDKMSAGWPNA